MFSWLRRSPSELVRGRLMAGALARIAAAPLSPSYGTHEAARAYAPDLTLDEYALARVVASEHGRGTPTEMGCIADASVNHAAGAPLFAHVTAGRGFGAQEGRPMSTRLPPGPRHIEAARAVLRRSFFGALSPALQGVARSARRYISPRSQQGSFSEGSSKHCPALVILERWTYAKEWANRSRCELSATRGRGQLEWVGPIPGVDPWTLMLFRPATLAQDALYADARRVIESGGSYKGRLRPLGAAELLAVGALIAAAQLGRLT